MLAIGLLAALGYALHLELQSPGEVIRGELKAAAADVYAAPARPSGAFLKRVGGRFSHRAVSVDAQVWPQVSVTLHGLTRGTCRDAASLASRIEGLVVVQLVNYRGVGDCGDANDMTWRIMP